MLNESRCEKNTEEPLSDMDKAWPNSPSHMKPEGPNLDILATIVATGLDPDYDSRQLGMSSSEAQPPIERNSG